VSEGPAKKEEKPRKFQAIRGTRDLLPPETALWNRVEQTAHEVFGTFGFGEIRLPIFEPTELFARAVGDETDIVSKEMYAIEEPTFRNLELLRCAIFSDKLSTEESYTAGRNMQADVRSLADDLAGFLRILENVLSVDESQRTPADAKLSALFSEIDRERAPSQFKADFSRWSTVFAKVHNLVGQIHIVP
jgi:hypothetical protein